MLLAEATALPLNELAIVAAVLLISTLVRSTFGFGDALISMPLLAMSVGLPVARPLVSLGAILSAVFILASSWRDVDWRSSLRLLPAAAVGIPVGFLALEWLPSAGLKVGLGALLMLYSTRELWFGELPELANDRHAWPFSLASGIFAGAFNIAGPPVVIYGHLRRWSPETFRATLISFFFPITIMVSTLHALGGSTTVLVLDTFVKVAPAIFAGYAIGSYFNRRFAPERFRVWVNALIAVLGFFMVFKVFYGGG